MTEAEHKALIELIIEWYHWDKVTDNLESWEDQDSWDKFGEMSREVDHQFFECKIDVLDRRPYYREAQKIIREREEIPKLFLRVEINRVDR